MDRRSKKVLAAQVQPVPMPVAASLVYHHLNHEIGVPSDYTAAMNSTALALSQVSDVYHVDRGRLLRIPSEDLAAGVFEERGETYRAASGRVYRSLSMRRIDVMDAMVVLRKARTAISDAKIRAKNH